MAVKENMKIKSERRGTLQLLKICYVWRFQKLVILYVERRRLSQQQSQQSLPTLKPAPVTSNGYLAKAPVRTTTSVTTTKKNKKDKNKKITKADIGLPSDFKHLSHVGWDPNQGFALDNVDPNLLKFFAKVKL